LGKVMMKVGANSLFRNKWEMKCYVGCIRLHSMTQLGGWDMNSYYNAIVRFSHMKA